MPTCAVPNRPRDLGQNLVQRKKPRGYLGFVGGGGGHRTRRWAPQVAEVPRFVERAQGARVVSRRFASVHVLETLGRVRGMWLLFQAQYVLCEQAVERLVPTSACDKET